jgi:hypothetical protein
MCGYHGISDELLADPGLPDIRSRLAAALHRRYYLQEPCVVRTLADASREVGWYEARDPEEDRERAVAALVELGPDGRELLWTRSKFAVSKVIGLSPDDANGYIRELEARKVVRTECRSFESLPEVCQWVVAEAPDQ